MMDRRARARELATEYIAKGDPFGWFEALYREGEAGKSIIPWADARPNPLLVEFWEAHGFDTTGKRALVIAGGLGDDAEQLAQWGFDTLCFDISPTAIEMAKRRFPETRVEYTVADLFQPPREWLGSFDFVFETNTLQALPAELRESAAKKIAQFPNSGGLVLVAARGREENEPEGDLPWPLTRNEMDGFVRAGLRVESFDDFAEPEPPWVRRFRALYRKPEGHRSH